MSYVQGARRPGGWAVRDFDQQMFSLGFHCTSGFRCSGSYHGCGPVREGAASDWGDSVNDLRRQWIIAWPHRYQLAEMLGPWGLYRWGRRFYHAQLQAQHRDHNHFAVTRKITLQHSHPKPRYWYMTKTEREHALNLEARRRSAKRNGGWDKIDKSHLESAIRSENFLKRANERVHEAARQSGWDRNNRRLRHQAFHYLIT